MARHDIRSLDALDRSASVVGTEVLHRQGVQRLRVLSESRFLDMVRRLVEESLSDRISEATLPGPAAEADETPLDRRLRQEYQHRWEALKTRHGAELQQVERRIDRLSRSLREIDIAIRDLREAESSVEEVSRAHDEDGASEVAGRDAEAHARATNRTTLLREMLLGDAD